MPSKTTAKPVRQPAGDDWDDFLADLPDENPVPVRAQSPAAGRDKRKSVEVDELGITEALELKKRPRRPKPKLDEQRLLSENGIPELRRRAKHLKLKGKGHEWSDAARLLSLYQLWLDDLFPKGKFLDALAMVEKLGHKKSMHVMRMEWINEGKPRSTVEWDDEAATPADRQQGEESSAAREPSRVAPVFERAAGQRQQTPLQVDDLFGDDDIYNATPRARTTAASQPADGAPEADDLDALMAEVDAESGTKPSGVAVPRGDAHAAPPRPGSEPDEDDLDALMAEAEMQVTSARPARPAISIFGNGKAKEPVNLVRDEEDDLDALMAEAEFEVQTSTKQTRDMPTEQSTAHAVKSAVGEDEDALDALIAEVEEAEVTGQPGRKPESASSAAKQTDRSREEFVDEEQVMAEMETL